MDKQVAIIILTKNNPHTFSKCIESIARYTISTSYKIYVGDTGSDEVNMSIMINKLKSLFDKNTCTLLQFPGYNFAANNNTVIKHHVNEPYILFCNDDIELKSNCIDRMYNWCVDHELVGSVGCRLEFPTGAIQHAGQIAYIDSTGLLQCTHRGYGEHTIFKNQTTTGNTAAFMMTSREVFDNAGGFDEQFTECWEDIQLNMKYIINGYTNWYLDDVVATHHESMTRTRSPEALYRLRYDYTYKLKPWFESLDKDKQQWILNYSNNK
jgi:O-antigen biosynthesis protein